MKKLGLFLLIVLLVLAIAPISASGAPDVRGTLVCNDVFISPGENAVLKIEVTNYDSSSVVVYSYASQGQTAYRPTTIHSGGTHTFYHEVAIDFGMNREKSIDATVDVEALGVITTNAIVVYEQLPPPTLTTAFTVTPNGAVSVQSGDSIDYSISMTNTGNIFYGPIQIMLDSVQIIPDFDLYIGQSRTFTYTKTYTGSTNHSFTYDITYFHNGVDYEFSLSAPITTHISIAPTPTPTPAHISVPLPGLSLTPSLLTAMVEEGGSIDLTLIFKNDSIKDLKNIVITDAFDLDYGGWANVKMGQTASMTFALAPTEQTLYIFSATAVDDADVTYLVDASPLLLVIGTMQSSTPTAFAEPQPTLAQSNKSESYPTPNIGSNLIYILLGVIILALISSVIVITTVVRKKNNSKKGN